MTFLHWNVPQQEGSSFNSAFASLWWREQSTMSMNGENSFLNSSRTEEWERGAELSKTPDKKKSSTLPYAHYLMLKFSALQPSILATCCTCQRQSSEPTCLSHPIEKIHNEEVFYVCLIWLNLTQLRQHKNRCAFWTCKRTLLLSSESGRVNL